MMPTIEILISQYKTISYQGNINQRTSGPVNAHLISWPSKAQKIQNLESFHKKFGSDRQSSF